MFRFWQVTYKLKQKLGNIIIIIKRKLGNYYYITQYISVKIRANYVLNYIVDALSILQDTCTACHS